MVSDYEYISLAGLENFVGLDYSAIDSTAFSDARVEATISVAEKIVTAYLGGDSAQTKTDGIEVCTYIIAAKLMYNKMVQMGYATEGQEGMDLIQQSIRSTLKMFLDNDIDIGVDSIPMSGANRDIVGNSI